METLTMKTKSGHAQCAAAIRAELKKVFPNIKFSVTSESFSMGNAVRVGWIDGPTFKEVDEITDKYQYGHFDGMQDMYEYSNKRADIPQAKYITTSRSMSQATRATLDAEVGKLHPEERDNLAYRLFTKTSLAAGAVVLRIEPTEFNKCWYMRDCSKAREIAGKYGRLPDVKVNGDGLLVQAEQSAGEDRWAADNL